MNPLDFVLITVLGACAILVAALFLVPWAEDTSETRKRRRRRPRRS